MNAEKLFELLSNDKFLRMEGLGNEVPFFVYAYDIRQQAEIYKRINLLTKRLSVSGIEVCSVGLYDMAISHFEESGELEDLFQYEKEVTKIEFLKEMQTYLSVDSVIKPYFQTKLSHGNDGKELRNFRDSSGRLRSRPQNTQFFFKPGVTWTKLSSSAFASRIRAEGFVFDDTGRSAFPDDVILIKPLLGFLCSKLVNLFLSILNPSLSFTSGDIGNIPLLNDALRTAEIDENLRIAKTDWGSYETSWDFTNLPLLRPDCRQPFLQQTYTQLRTQWSETTLEMQRLEEENNRIFIEAYGLQDELTPEVPLQEITLTCNPWYRYGKKCEQQEPGAFPEDSELESRLKANTIREYISYAVGCLFGRYSIDKPGLVLANAGDGVDEYHRQIANPTFPPDESGILPLTEEDDFTDDLPTGVRKFIRTTFGEESYEKNLRFIEEALGKSLRAFLLKDLYKDHVKRYKKRPIYWQITSPSGIFRCLIYLHRYTPETVGQVLNGYGRTYIRKLEAQISQGELMLNSGTSGGPRRPRHAKVSTNGEPWSLS